MIVSDQYYIIYENIDIYQTEKLFDFDYIPFNLMRVKKNPYLDSALIDMGIMARRDHVKSYSLYALDLESYQQYHVITFHAGYYLTSDDLDKLHTAVLDKIFDRKE